MLLGIWDNVADLEAKLTLEELELILDKSREKEYQHQKFLAALKGIDLDEQSGGDARTEVERIKARAEARLRGEDPDKSELESLGIEVEVEE